MNITPETAIMIGLLIPFILTFFALAMAIAANGITGSIKPTEKVDTSIPQVDPAKAFKNSNPTSSIEIWIAKTLF